MSLFPAVSTLVRPLAFGLAVVVSSCLPSLVNGQAAGLQSGYKANGQQETNPQDSKMRQRPMSPEEIEAYRQTAAAANQREAAAQQAQARAAAPQLPEGFPLAAEDSKYVADLLDYWQRVSDQVNLYKCNFRRYSYDTGEVNLRDPRTNQLWAHQQAAGVIRFAAPDRARFETTNVFKFTKAPATPGDEAEYSPIEGNTIWGRDIHECWVSTGKSIFDFDFETKSMYETAIPPEMQGNVAQSPLPFLFGAKKDDILNRYWVRHVPKYIPDAKGNKVLNEDEYWLEVYPKRIGDARMYSKVELILSAKDFMPVAMHMYSANYNPSKNNFSSQYFLFENRKVNSQLDKFQDKILNSFVKPNMPLTWRTVKRQLGQEQSAAVPVQGQDKQR